MIMIILELGAVSGLYSAESAPAQKAAKTEAIHIICRLVIDKFVSMIENAHHRLLRFACTRLKIVQALRADRAFIQIPRSPLKGC